MIDIIFYNASSPHPPKEVNFHFALVINSSGLGQSSMTWVLSPSEDMNKALNLSYSLKSQITSLVKETTVYYKLHFYVHKYRHIGEIDDKCLSPVKCIAVKDCNAEQITSLQTGNNLPVFSFHFS